MVSGDWEKGNAEVKLYFQMEECMRDFGIKINRKDLDVLFKLMEIIMKVNLIIRKCVVLENRLQTLDSPMKVIGRMTYSMEKVEKNGLMEPNLKEDMLKALNRDLENFTLAMVYIREK